MQENSNNKSYQKRALVLCVLLILIVIGCILWIVWHRSAIIQPPTDSQSNIANASSPQKYADIYQNGELLQSILLSDITESYMFIISNESGSFNEIQVHSGSIGIISADCPDKLCVHQGFIQSSLLPITCLPNRLVIQIRQTENSAENIAPDIITY